MVGNVEVLDIVKEFQNFLVVLGVNQGLDKEGTFLASSLFLKLMNANLVGMRLGLYSGMLAGILTSQLVISPYSAKTC
jgi:hypothetical protein